MSTLMLWCVGTKNLRLFIRSSFVRAFVENLWSKRCVFIALYYEFLFYVTVLMAMSCNFVDSRFVACFELSNLCFLFVFLLVQDCFSHQECDGNIFLLSAWQDLELTWRQDFRHTCGRMFRLEEVVEFHSCKDLQSTGCALNIHLRFRTLHRFAASGLRVSAWPVGH